MERFKQSFNRAQTMQQQAQVQNYTIYMAFIRATGLGLLSANMDLYFEGDITKNLIIPSIFLSIPHLLLADSWPDTLLDS